MKHLPLKHIPTSLSLPISSPTLPKFWICWRKSRNVYDQSNNGNEILFSKACKMHSKMQCRSIQKELPLVLHIIIWHESGSRSRTARVSTLASGYITPSQQQRIISGLKETFIKRCIVKRTNKAEIRPEEQSETAKSCREKNGMTYSWKGHKDKNRHKNRIQRSG